MKYNKIDDWYIWANMYKGKYSMATFHSLDAYWPGLQVIYRKGLVVQGRIALSTGVVIFSTIVKYGIDMDPTIEVQI